MPDDRYVGLAPDVVYRGLEKPHLFHVHQDELYELSNNGLAFLEEIDGTRRKSELRDRELLAFAEAEGLLAFSPEPRPRALARGQSPAPSLRYLELILTRRCNLRCGHCYLGDQKAQDLAPELLERAIAEFDQMQGLRLLLSGGEPLLYPRLPRLSSLLSGRGFRAVLLTNGTLLDREKLASLPVHEVQISLDGLEPGHDALRGKGSFQKAAAAARLVRESGRDLSVATMIHRGNQSEMNGLEALVRELGAREWSLEVPTPLGRWAEGREFQVSQGEVGDLLTRGFGGSYHGGSEGMTCGLHLAAILPGGEVARCGFYEETPLGHLAEGLGSAWSRKVSRPVSSLPVCRDCPAALECGGGCRFRAGGEGPDPVMCAKFGRRLEG